MNRKTNILSETMTKVQVKGEA